MSESQVIGAVVGQGTLGGALVSQAVLDGGVCEKFKPGDCGELNYGSVRMAPLMFQDDLLHGVESVDKAREGNRKVDIIMKERCLSLNQDKSVCIAVCPKVIRNEI